MRSFIFIQNMWLKYLNNKLYYQYLRYCLLTRIYSHYIIFVIVIYVIYFLIFIGSLSLNAINYFFTSFFSYNLDDFYILYYTVLMMMLFYPIKVKNKASDVNDSNSSSVLNKEHNILGISMTIDHQGNIYHSPAYISQNYRISLEEWYDQNPIIQQIQTPTIENNSSNTILEIISSKDEMVIEKTSVKNNTLTIEVKSTDSIKNDFDDIYTDESLFSPNTYIDPFSPFNTSRSITYSTNSNSKSKSIALISLLEPISNEGKDETISEYSSSSSESSDDFSNLSDFFALSPSEEEQASNIFSSIIIFLYQKLSDIVTKIFLGVKQFPSNFIPKLDNNSNFNEMLYQHNLLIFDLRILSCMLLFIITLIYIGVFHLPRIKLIIDNIKSNKFFVTLVKAICNHITAEPRIFLKLLIILLIMITAIIYINICLLYYTPL